MLIWEERNNDYYKAKHLNFQTGFDLTAYLENEADLSFWYSVFGKFAPSLKIEFEYNSRMDLSRGKNEILKSKDKLGTYFILCLDSDWDYLLEKEYLNPEKNPFAKFIFQTYTYSIENYQCNAENLNKLCVEASLNHHLIFDFQEFLKDFSKCIYKLMLFAIGLEKINIKEKLLQPKGDKNTSEDNLAKLLDIQKKELENNGQKMIESLKKKVEIVENKLNIKYPAINLSQIQADLSNKFSAQPENIYQHLIGHILYDKVVKGLLIQIVRKMRTEKYNEFNNSNEDKETLQNKRNQYKKQIEKLNIETLLAHNHIRCLAFNNCELMQKIQIDIQQFISSLQN